MKIFFYRFLILTFLTTGIASGISDHCIIYVHIGDKIPEYAHEAIKQARLFNPDTPIYMLANQKGLEHFNGIETINIPLETLKPSKNHLTFTKNTQWRNSLFRFALERFFFLHEFVEQYNLKHVFHMEYDNMLYVNLQELLPIFINHYPQIGATFDNDKRVIAGFIYFRDSSSLGKLVNYMGKKSKKMDNDMAILANYSRKNDKQKLSHLPIIHSTYRQDHSLHAPNGERAKLPTLYSSHIEAFNGIFDAAALGQFLGGIDGSHHTGGGVPGFVNESCVFDPSKLEFLWEKDPFGRKLLFAIYKNEKRRIINLHVHSKNLKQFRS